MLQPVSFLDEAKKLTGFAPVCELRAFRET
jgi:hypothetical protein